MTQEQVALLDDEEACPQHARPIGDQLVADRHLVVHEVEDAAERTIVCVWEGTAIGEGAGKGGGRGDEGRGRDGGKGGGMRESGGMGEWGGMGERGGMRDGGGMRERGEG